MRLLKHFVFNFLLIFSFALHVNSLFAQSNSQDDMMKEFIKSRQRMMNEMIKAFDEESFTSDYMSEDFLKDILGYKFNENFGESESMVGIKQVQKTDGSVDLFLKPRDQSVSMDIDTQESVIIIKAVQKSEVKNESKKQVTRKISRGEYSQSITIPFGFTASSPKVVDGRVKITLTPNKKNKPDLIDRKPITKRKGEGVI